MDDTVKRKKCWILRAELVALVCVACICVIKAVTVDMDSTKAAVLKLIYKTSSSNAQNGERIVTAIFYDEDNPSVVIGSERGISKGDTIHGVKVVKIHKDKVEFEKNGQSWAQKVSEQPAAHWE